MKNALILHGAGNNSQGNWFPWLKAELEEKGYKVWVPDLPNAAVPMQKDWLETVFSNKEWKFTNESIIIGHSAGSTLILRILERLPEDTKIHKAILVAGPVQVGTIPEHAPYKKDLTKDPFNWEKIKQSADKFFFINSDNDPYECGQEQGKIMQEHLGGELIIKQGQGHFNLEVDPPYNTFPFLLTLID